MGLLATIAGMFATEKAADTALNLIERLGSSSLTDKEKLDYALKWAETTKHQSIPRRVIAFMVVCFWILCGLCVVVLVCMDDINKARLIRDFMADVMTQPANLVIGFYFALGLVKGHNSGGK